MNTREKKILKKIKNRIWGSYVTTKVLIFVLIDSQRKEEKCGAGKKVWKISGCKPHTFGDRQISINLRSGANSK